jgi:outer membrane autotransporter protein
MAKLNNAKGKKSYFKKVLTTASALAVIAGAASDARATLWYGNNGDVTLPADDTVPTKAVTDANGVTKWSDNDSFYFDTNNIGLTLNKAQVSTIDVNGSIYVINGTDQIPINITDDSGVGSITDGNGGGAKAVVTVEAGKTLTFANLDGVAADGATPVDAGSYDVVGSMTLGSAGDVDAASLVINVATDIDFTINTRNGSNAGSIIINAATTFGGVLGGEVNGSLGTITSNATTTFSAAVTAETVTSNATTTFSAAVTAETVNANQNTNFNSTANVTNLNIASAKTVTLKGNFTGDIDGTASNAGVLKINATNVTVDGIIGSNYPLSKIQVPLNITGATFNKYVSVNTLDLNADVTFGGGLTVGDFLFGNQVTLTVNGDFSIGTVVDTVGGSSSLAISNGTGTITSAGTSENGLDTFSASNVQATVANGIYATNIGITNSTVKITKDVTFEGKYVNDTATTINGSTLDLGSSKLTNTGNVTMTGDNVLNVTLAGDVNAVTGGKVVISGDLNFDSNSTLTINISDTEIKNGLRSHVFYLFTSAGGTPISASNITINDQQPLLKWTPTVTSKGIYITTSDDSTPYLNETFKGHEKDFEGFRDAAKNDARVEKVFNLIEDFAEEGRRDKIQETFKRVLFANKSLVGVASNSLSSAQNTVAARVSSFAMPSAARVASSDNITGVSAGDESTKYGVWVNPFYARANQQEKNESVGYKSVSYGASLGFDSKFSDDLVLGAAFTVANSYTKYKDLKSGDKTRFRSVLLSIYNMYNLTENWFMYGSATVGDSRVHNESKRVSSLDSYEIAEGKHGITSFGAKEMFGYNFATDSATITPMFGLKYSRVNNIKYQEGGTTNQNLNISTKTMHKWEAVAGASISGKAYDYLGAMFTPEMHGFAEYNLFNKTQRSLVKLNSFGVTSESKDKRVCYNAGLGLKAEYNAFEYELGYDANLADKFVSHQGSFKVRVNF